MEVSSCSTGTNNPRAGNQITVLHIRKQDMYLYFVYFKLYVYFKPYVYFEWSMPVPLKNDVCATCAKLSITISQLLVKADYYFSFLAACIYTE